MFSDINYIQLLQVRFGTSKSRHLSIIFTEIKVLSSNIVSLKLLLDHVPLHRKCSSHLTCSQILISLHSIVAGEVRTPKSVELSVIFTGIKVLSSYIFGLKLLLDHVPLQTKHSSHLTCSQILITFNCCTRGSTWRKT